MGKIDLCIGHIRNGHTDLAEEAFAELKELRDRILWLECLEEAGVDNWSGYDYAGDLYRERLKHE